MNQVEELMARKFVPRVTYVICKEELLRLEKLRDSMQEPKGWFSKLVYNWVMNRLNKRIEGWQLMIDTGLEALGVLPGGIPDYVTEMFEQIAIDRVEANHVEMDS